MKKAFGKGEILLDSALWVTKHGPLEAASLWGQHGWQCILPPS